MEPVFQYSNGLIEAGIRVEAIGNESDQTQCQEGLQTGLITYGFVDHNHTAGSMQTLATPLVLIYLGSFQLDASGPTQPFYPPELLSESRSNFNQALFLICPDPN